MAERYVRNVEVGGSNPLTSTKEVAAQGLFLSRWPLGRAWELRAYAGRDALRGRKRYKTKTVRVRGRREAEKALAALVTELETSGVAADGTFGELVERWIATAVPGWSPANEVTVRNTVSYYLAPLLPVKLSKLNTADLDAFYVALRNGGGRGGRPLAVSTVRRVHSVVRASLEQGVRWGWLRENPASRASPGPGQVPEIHPPAPDAVLALLQRAEQDDKAFAVFLVLAAVTGARRGELVALRWSDLDLERCALTITRAISEGVHGPVDHPRPKTPGLGSPPRPRRRHGRHPRGPPLSARRGRCHVRRPAAGRCFCLLPRTRRLGAVEAGLREPQVPPSAPLGRSGPGATARPAPLRGYHPPRCGVDLQTVAGRLGHPGGGRTTLAVYSHFQQAADRNAADLLGKLLSPKG